MWGRSGDRSIVWSVFPCSDSLPLPTSLLLCSGQEGPPEIPGMKVSATAGVHMVGKATTLQMGFCLSPHRAGHLSHLLVLPSSTLG